MKLTIKSNGQLISTLVRAFDTISKNYTTKQTKVKGDIYSVEIEFEPCALYSDLEFWLEDENGKYCDHLALNVSKRQKLLTHK